MELFNSAKQADMEWARQIMEIVNLPGTDYAQNIQAEIEQYEKKKITIAVVGLMKRGKSTFCNAFLNRNDDELAPIGKLPATGIISKYCSDPERNNAEVHFQNDESKIISHQDIRQYVTEEFNKDNYKKIDLVTVYGDFGFDKNVELMDMPGDGSIHAYHTEIVYRYLPQADVIIFLSSAQDPIQQEELSLLKKVNLDLHNIFFVINKADKCDEEELLDAETQDLSVLENAHIQVNKMYRISAKDVLAGKVSADFQSLLSDIHNFLNSSKIYLQRGTFIKRIQGLAAPALSMLETNTKLKKMKLEDLNTAVIELDKASDTMQQQAADITASFKEHWKQMVNEFSNALPAAESNVQTRVAAEINNYPMMAINRKFLDKLPEMISTIIEEELQKPTQAFEEQVRNEIARVNADFPSITKYLSDESYRVAVQNKLGYGIGSSIVGGMLFSTNMFAGCAISGIVSGATSVPWVGSVLGATLGTVALPLTALTVIGMTGGALFMALPVFSWIRGKKMQKLDILDSAKASIENAFRSMRLTKLPELARKADEFISMMNQHFETERTSLSKQLQDSISQKKLLTTEVSAEAFQKDECSLQCLQDLLEQGNQVILDLNKNYAEQPAQ